MTLKSDKDNAVVEAAWVAALNLPIKPASVWQHYKGGNYLVQRFVPV